MQGDRVAAGSEDARRWYDRSVAVLEQARALQDDEDRRFGARVQARGGTIVAVTANAVLLNDLALAYVRTRRFDDALAVFEAWRHFEPGNAKRHVDVSAVLCNLGRWEDCAVALVEALLVEPGNADAGRRL